MTLALEIRGADLGYESMVVVRNMDLVVERGEVVALLGANGAGKSTTLLSVSGIARVFRGRVRVGGRDTPPRARPEQISRSGVSHVPESRALFFPLTVRENLEVAFRPKHLRGRGADVRAVEGVLSIFPELEPLLDRQAGLLSGGEQQMLALGRALVSEPTVLMVDEMSLGLAPVVARRVMPRLRTFAQESGCGVLVVEQLIDLALSIADRGYVLAHGEVVLSGTAEELRSDRQLVQSSYLGSGDGTNDAAPTWSAAPEPRSSANGIVA